LRWKQTVDSYGYDSYWQVLNSRDYDIPQNRERVFLVSIRRDNPDTPERYYFPAPMEQTRQIVDFLDKEVPEEYYLKSEQVEKFYDLLNNAGVDYEETSDYSETNKKIREELGSDYKPAKKVYKIDNGLLDSLFEKPEEDIESDILCDSSCSCGEHGSADEIDGYVPNLNTLF
jgi:site-specific DNA-cytosine methylase